MKTSPDPSASIERHSRKCAICTHPDRQAIDEAFLHQSHNFDIVKDYNLPSLSSLYRHAHATGLWLRHNPTADSNRENEARTAGQPNSNRESIQSETSNRENNPCFSGTTTGQMMTAEIQRMLIGK